jgi:Tfp pilus assembly protein FimT
MLVSGLITVTMGIAVPTVMAHMRAYALNTTMNTVSAEIRGARYTAVSKNRTVRVRFNCPAANQFRIVEVVGNATIDNAADRCSDAVYPYPVPNPNAAPNLDGPIMRLPQGAQFGAVRDLEISPVGRVTPLTGCPTCATAAPPASLVMSNTYDTRTITVNASGQVLLP